MTDHTGISRRQLSGQELKFRLTTETFFLQTTWCRNKLFEMEDGEKLRFDCALNENGLKVPINRPRIAKWVRKQGPYVCCFQGIHFRSKDTQRLKVKG